MSAGIPCGLGREIRFSPVLWGPAAPAVRVEAWTSAAGTPRYTGQSVLIPTPMVERLVRALQAAAAESMQGPLFAPAFEERQ